MYWSIRMPICILFLTLSAFEVASAETLCGGELELESLPIKPNYPERSLSNLGQRRFSPLYPPDPLLFNVSHPTIKNSLSDRGNCEKLESPAPSPPLLCPVSSLFHAKSVLLPLPLPLFHALFISAELAKDKAFDLPFSGNALPANSSKPISNSSIRRHNKISRPTSRSNSRRSQNRGIVEECCFNSCNLALLEQYCAKPAKSERDVSATSLQVIMPTLKQEVPRKHVTVKYSKYDMWQRKAAQRLRRGVPAILRAKKFRRQAERIRAQEQLHHHRPLITLPSKLPPILLPTEDYVSHNPQQPIFLPHQTCSHALPVSILAVSFTNKKAHPKREERNSDATYASGPGAAVAIKEGASVGTPKGSCSNAWTWRTRLLSSVAAQNPCFALQEERHCDLEKDLDNPVSICRDCNPQKESHVFGVEKSPQEDGGVVPGSMFSIVAEQLNCSHKEK
nr:insulin-like growth factor II [Osteobrama belangeri]